MILEIGCHLSSTCICTPINSHTSMNTKVTGEFWERQLPGSDCNNTGYSVGENTHVRTRGTSTVQLNSCWDTSKLLQREVLRAAWMERCTKTGVGEMRTHLCCVREPRGQRVSMRHPEEATDVILAAGKTAGNAELGTKDSFGHVCAELCWSSGY